MLRMNWLGTSDHPPILGIGKASPPVLFLSGRRTESQESSDQRFLYGVMNIGCRAILNWLSGSSKFQTCSADPASIAKLVKTDQ
jgi:hypothetical protein